MKDYEKVLRNFIENKIISSLQTTDKQILYNLRGQAFGALMFAQEADLIPYETLYQMWEGENGYYDRFYIPS